MFFLPAGCSILILFILFLPILFVLGFFHIITIGFENLGISPEATFLLLVLILFGSVVNIPLTRKKLVQVKEYRFFSFFHKPKLIEQGIAVNLGGGIIPFLLCIFFLSKIPLEPVLAATAFMIIICYYLARIVPGRGIALPFFVPPIFSAIFALILAPGFAAPCAFVSGVLGALIGADILNIRKAQRLSPGFISIGGAGVFDGIFLVGIVSSLLTSF
ncbi:DUF1614 domain-containing protein [Candidatus Parcubacteria bacterium]|nr:DUF1614 domain-containing protein [Candidatus Parcubacteria bacterium]